MAVATTGSDFPSAKKAADSEINRLRAQVRELQSELSRRRTTTRQGATAEPQSVSGSDDASYDQDDPSDMTETYTSKTSQVARDLPTRTMDEAGKFMRGMAFAYLEHLKVTSDALNMFADEVYARNKPESTDSRDQGRRTISDLAMKLPGDMYSGFIRALDRSLDSPSASVHGFHSAYRETEEEAEPTLRRQRRREAARDDQGGSPISAEPRHPGTRTSHASVEAGSGGHEASFRATVATPDSSA